jgi:hypothetical protein
MNGLQIYILGCLLAYPIGLDFLKMYSKASTDKNLIAELQKRFEETNVTKNNNFFQNWLIGIIVLMSWIMVIVWSYFKIKILYYTIKYYLFRK